MQAEPELLEELTLERGLDALLQPALRRVIETQILPAYLQRRRWFAAKDATLHAVTLGPVEPMTGAFQGVLLAQIEAHLGGRSERYVLPLAIAWDDEGIPAPARHAALARVRQGARAGVLTDAFALDTMPLAALQALRRQGALPLPDAELRFLPTTALNAITFPETPEIHRLSAEQSNTSLIIADRAVMKLVRRVTAGIHPEAEMTRYLTERGFANTAPLLGEVVRADASGQPQTIIIMQGFLRNQGDGWGWTLDFLARATDADTLAAYASFAAALGQRLGELHAVLAMPDTDPAFAPEIVGEGDLLAWADGAIAQLDGALDRLSEARDGALAARLIGQRSALHHALRALAANGAGALKTRVHGDFHLGQVLVVQGDAFIIDFEGEPARGLDARRAKSSPARDVAGLLRSFDYAAASVPSLPAPLAERFGAEAKAVFLGAYARAHAAAPRRWIPESAEKPLLDLFLIEKAAYEVSYEAANRPTWIAIPLRGLSALADRVLSAGKTAREETTPHA